MKLTLDSKQTFDQDLNQNQVPVLVDFYADWCGPCQVLLPTVDSVAEEYEGKAKVIKVNVDEHPELARHFGITSIPTLLFFNKGELAKRLNGVQSRSTLTRSLDELAQA